MFFYLIFDLQQKNLFGCIAYERGDQITLKAFEIYFIEIKVLSICVFISNYKKFSFYVQSFIYNFFKSLVQIKTLTQKYIFCSKIGLRCFL